VVVAPNAEAGEHEDLLLGWGLGGLWR
jgi:hypothetical protein